MGRTAIKIGQNRLAMTLVAVDAVCWGALLFFGIHFFTCDARMNSVTFSGNPSLSILDGSGYIRISQTVSGSPSSFAAVSQIASGAADIYGSITYMSA